MGTGLRIGMAGLVALVLAACAAGGPAVDAQCRVVRVAQAAAAGRPVAMADLGGLGNPPSC
jgi:hypothetical protein